MTRRKGWAYLPDCPNAANHAPSPQGYLRWHVWAEEMAKTHTQHKCPGCDHWLILKPLTASLPGGTDG